MKHILYVLSFLLISISCTAQGRQPSLKFYVLTHPEQLHLYMSGNAMQDIFATKESTNRVVMIYLTSTDDNNCSEITRKPANQYKINEIAARNAVEIILNTYEYNDSSKLVWMSDWQVNRSSFNGHKVLQWKNKNTASYFLRLPNGCPDRYNNQSLEKLYNGQISNIAAIDTSATYDSWEDLALTIREIMKFEAANRRCPVWLNIPEADPHGADNATINNRYASQIATEAFSELPATSRIFSFTEADITSLATNMSPEQIVLQASMCAAADFTRTNQGQPSAWEETLKGKIGKTYKKMTR